jgi:hypothetical protein
MTEEGRMLSSRRAFMQAVMTGAVGASFTLRGSAQAPPPIVATKLA